MALRPHPVLYGAAGVFSHMIRRNPTLIAMSNADVQDVRNMLAKKQAEAIRSPNLSAGVKGRQGPQPQPASTTSCSSPCHRRSEA